MFFQALRIIEDTKPKVAIAENVKNLTSKKFKEQFEIVLDSLESAGYNNYWQVLNAKDYGIPQNRERVFIISIRKDVDTGVFKFPEPIELNLRLKDLLETEVDEKFYLSKKLIDYIKDDATHKESDNCFTEPQVKQIGNCCPTKTRDNPNQGRIYDTEGLSPALNCMGGGNRQPCVPVYTAAAMRGRYNNSGQVEQNLEISDREYANAITTVQKDSMIAETERPVTSLAKERFFRQAQETLIENECEFGDTVDAFNKRVNKSKLCPTLTTRPEGFKTAILPVTNDLRIRKLTPLECWRLMGFEDQDFYKAEKVNSNSQLYKQAGNSIVVNVLEAIFNELYIEKIFTRKV